MKIYFNWLGEWIELDNDEDLINDMNPKTFINGISKLNSQDDIILYAKTLNIRKSNHIYYIPANLLVWEEI